MSLFKAQFNDTSWDSTFTQLDPNIAMETFLNKFKSIYKQNIPTTLYTSAYKTDKPWITDAILTSIKKKNQDVF